ncbi:hypothetical protein CR51_31180 [Caballeronia megalochromosomata]|nr:hypothetical protein CR51_31180 [Caballeronia megalochromosomata]
MSVIDKFWLDLHEARRQWAYDAFSDFVKDIDPELTSGYGRSEHVTVVVYGSTQVGKTTLMLDMLGIEPAHAAEVGAVLRGGRKIGTSSTVTALRYRKSSDDGWRIGVNGRSLTNAEATDAFGALREQVEDGSVTTPDVIDVFIPRRFFSSGSEAFASDIRLLDLPGLNAANANEAAHVRRIAETYVLNADLIVLVGRINNLGFLRPVELQLPQLQDWASYPMRFRVVFTYSFSSASFREWFDENARTVEQVRKRLVEQLELHDIELSPGAERYVYPLEFGQSWAALEQAEGAYFERAKSMAGELWTDFMDSVRRAANPYSRVRMAFGIQQAADLKIRKFRSASMQRRQALRERIDAESGAVSGLESHLEALTEASIALERRRRALASVDDAAWLESRLDGEFPSSNSAVPPRASLKRPSSVRDAADAARQSLVQAWVNQSTKCVELDRPGARETGPEADLAWQLDARLGSSPAAREIDELIDRLDGYLFDWYSPVFSALEKDHEEFIDAVRAVRKRFVKAAVESITGQAHKESDALARKLSMQEAQRKMAAATLKKRRASLEAVCKERASAYAERKNFERRMQRSIEHGRQFQAHMQRAHDAALDDAQQRFREEPDPVRQFYRLMFERLIEGELRNLMNGEST